MKKIMITTATAIAVILGALAATARAEDEQAGDAETAIMCPKCETVWVKRPDRPGRKTETYVSVKKMKCEDCKNAIESFFATGEFKHTCATCGDMVMCKVHPEPTSGPAPSDSKFVPGPGHEKK